MSTPQPTNTPFKWRARLAAVLLAWAVPLALTAQTPAPIQAQSPAPPPTHH